MLESLIISPLGSCSPVCPLGALYCVRGVLGHLAPVHRYARLVCCVVSAVSSATWLLFSGVLARCVVLCVACVVLRVQGFAAGRALVHLDGSFSLPAGAGYRPGAHTSIRTDAVS